MNAFEPNDLYIMLVRPGETDLDQQGRIMGTLDVPLNENGQQQIAALNNEVAEFPIVAVYSGPGMASLETARLMLDGRDIKIRTEDDLQNLDYGLWHGKRIDELKETQPKLFKQWLDHPETVCPPDGETVESVTERAERILKRVQKKHKSGVVVIVVPEPIACIIRGMLQVDSENKWHVSGNCGCFENICVSLTSTTAP